MAQNPSLARLFEFPAFPKNLVEESDNTRL